jgi:hypothetical protein
MSSNTSEDRPSLCAFTFADGRRCRLPRPFPDSEYCHHHQRKLRHLRQADATAAELVEPISGDFVPATALTHSLTRLFYALAEGRIDPKNATALARVANTLLKSINKSNEEFQQCYLGRFWRQLIRGHFNDLPDYIPPDPPQPRPAPEPKPSGDPDPA